MIGAALNCLWELFVIEAHCKYGMKNVKEAQSIKCTSSLSMAWLPEVYEAIRCVGGTSLEPFPAAVFAMMKFSTKKKNLFRGRTCC